MADLGNLWYNLGIKDNTNAGLAAAIAKIKKQLNSNPVTVKIGSVEVDAKAAKDFVSKLESKMGSVNVSGIKLGVDRAHIQSELSAAPFNIDLKLNVKQMQVQDAIQQAFAAVGMSWNGMSAAQARMNRVNQQQRRSDDLHAESMLRQQRLRESLNKGLDRSYVYHKSINDTMRVSTQLATVLGNTLGNVFSVYMVKNFLSEIVKVGGEIQKQNLAMENILGDSFKAHENYQRIKNLAVISPFNVQDLTTYSRRLSAFGVEYNQLYDTMKRLADISAGVGTDFSRIALVYGETLERTFLDAKLLRQFSYAGVPMIQKLTDLYTKREQTIVTGSDVRNRIKNREVSFEDVNEVIKDLTSEGGKFYNMQEAMAESLATKWNNVGVAMDIAFANMADGSLGSALKTTAETLTALARNYEQVGVAASNVALGLAAYKVSQFILNQALNQGTAAALKNAQAEKLRQANFLKIQSKLRVLNAEERKLVATRNELTMADYKQLAIQGRITKEGATRLWMTRDLNKQLSFQEKRMLVLTANTLGFTRAERQAMLAMGTMTRMSLGLRTAFKGLLTTMRSFLFNPFFLIFAGLEALFATIEHFNQKADESKRRVEAIGEAGREGARNLDELMQSASFMNAPTSKAGYKTAIDEMVNAIKDYDPAWETTLSAILGNKLTGQTGIKDVSKQYEALKNEIISLDNAYHKLEEIKEVVERANDFTDGWFNDSMLKNLKDYQDALRELDGTIRNHKKLQETYIKFLEEARNKNADFAKAVTNSDGKLKNYSEQLKILARDFGGLLSGMVMNQTDTRWRGMMWLKEASDSVSEFMETAKKDVKDGLADILDQFDSMGLDPTNPENQRALKKAIDITFNDAGITDPSVRELLYNEAVSRKMRIFAVVEWQNADKPLEDFQKLGIASVDGYNGNAAWVIEVKTAIKNKIKSQDDPSQLAKDLEKLLKEYEEKLKPLVGDDTTVATNSIYQDEVDKLNAGIKIIKDAAAAMYLNLEDPALKKAAKDQKQEESEWAKRMKNRISMVKKAYDEYKKLYELYHDESKALDEMKGTDLFKEFFSSADMKDPKALLDNYKSLLAEVNKMNVGGKYDAIKMQLTEAIFNFNQDEIKRKAKEAADVLKASMEKDAENWDLYNSLVSSGKNHEFAWRVAFEVDRKLFDDTAAEWAMSLRAAMEEKGGYVIREMKPFGIDFDMTQKEAEKFFGSDGGLYDLYVKIKERIEKNGIDLFKNAADASKSLDTIQLRIEKIKQDMANAIAGLGQNADPGAIAMVETLYGKEIEKLRQELYEGSEVFKKLNADTTNFGIAKLAQLKALAKAVKEAMDSGTTTKDEKGNVIHNFTYDGQEYSATEKNYDAIGKLIEKLEKKAKSATDSFRNMWDWISGKKDADGARKAFAEVSKDIETVFDELSSMSGELSSIFGTLFGNDSNAGKIASGISTSFKGLSQFTQALDQFSAGDWMSGITTSMQSMNSILSSIQQIGSISDIDRVIKEMEIMKNSLKTSIDKLGEHMLSQSTSDAYKTYLKTKENQDKAESDAMKDIAWAAGIWHSWYEGTGAHNSMNYEINDSLSDSDWKRISDTTGSKVESAKDLWSLTSKQWDSLIAEDYDIWEKIQKAMLDDKHNQRSEQTIKDIEDYANMWKEAREQQEAYFEYITGINFDDIRSGFDSLIKDMSSTTQSFADSFEEQMYNAIVNQQIIDTLGTKDKGPMKDYYDALLAYSEGGYDEKEIEKLREMYMGMAKTAQEIQETASEITGWDGGSSSSSLSSSISGATEGQVDTLSSYVNGIRGDQAAIRSILESISFSTLVTNSSAQLAELKSTNAYLKTIDENSAKVAQFSESIDERIRSVIDGNKKVHMG